MPEPLERLQSALAGRYTIERELGRGGMATVYLARDLKHDRPVAIKAVLPHIAAALGPDRFLREITTTARLQHPHILGLLDSGEFEGQLYYIMPFVAGESLRDRLNGEHQLSLEDAICITQEVANALDYAHQHGLIHRDIKPENILLSGGHAVVADFGIARAVEQAGGAKLTETGLAVGTPDYMSPEQAAGDAELDGRSDQYSLGCVLYEMLAGHSPFLGKNPQEVRARHALDPVPPLRAARATVSDGIEAALQRSLAKQPADRFPTVGAFATALSQVGQAAVRPRLRPHAESRTRWWLIAAALVLLAIGTLVWRRVPQPSASSLDPNLLAVAPFEVLDPSLDLWREGMGDVLSRYLDGAGQLHTVPPTVVLRHWAGRADRPSAEALARSIGAGLVVFGNAVLKGADSVLLRATVLRVADGGAQDEIEVEGETERMGALADSLGHGILEALGRSRPIGAVRRASLGAGSLPALKAFLRGEWLYRDGNWDSALVEYDRALARDSGFALANRRMAAILWFYPPTRHTYQPWPEYALRAQRLNHGLTAGDSLLIVALAHWANIEKAGTDNPTFLIDRREARAAVEQATARNPTDPEAWYFLGEALYHSIPEVGFTKDPLAAFDRGIALDSSFSTLYEHTVRLAIRRSSPDLARRYANAYRALGSDDDQAATFRLEAGLLAPRGGASPDVDQLFDTVRAWRPIWNVMWDLGWWPDSAETAVRIARTLPSPHHDLSAAPRWLRNPVVQKRLLALLLVGRGHLREAYTVVPETDVEGMFNPFLDLALFGAVPAATADAYFRALLSADSLWPPASEVGVERRHQAGTLWWVARRDTASLAGFARRAESAAHATAAPLARLQVNYFSDAARAYLLLLRGDSAAALKALDALPDSVCPVVACVHESLTRARLLAASGRDREAAQVLDRWIPAVTGTSFVLGHLERGRIAERLGEREKAILSYGYVVDAWRNADSVLQPYVAEARSGLKRLTTEPRP